MNRLTSQILQPFNKLIFFVILFCCQVLYSSVGFNGSSQKFDNSDDSDRTKVTFEEKLEFYLNDKTQHVVEELIARETQLSQLIRNIHQEIKLRDRSSILSDEPGFQEIESYSDSLLQEYDKELLSLIDIYDNIQNLLRIAEYSGKVDNWMQVFNLKTQLMSSIDDRNLYKKEVPTSKNIGLAVDEYTSELDSLLNIYDSFELLKRMAYADNDTAAIAQIERQQKALITIFGKWGPVGPLDDSDFFKYRDEIAQVRKVISDIKVEQANALEAEAEKLQKIKSDLLGRLDRSVLELLSTGEYSLPNYPTVSEMVTAWNAERLIDIKTRLTKSQIVWLNLLASADDNITDRMLKNELTDAILNYANGNYRVSEYQFSSILDKYSAKYNNLISVQFYMAECRYHRLAYDDAKVIYEWISQQPDSNVYKVESLVRLMQHENDFGSSEKFFQLYQKVLENETYATGELIPYAHYLAAKKCFENQQFEKAAEIIPKIKPDSEFYGSSQLLAGVISTNMGKYDTAIEIYKKIANEDSYPWTAMTVAYTRNTALLRLGLLYYQQGKYQLALEIFDRVSPGFDNYDQVLIVKAWICFQQKDYQVSIDHALELVRTFIASDYTYEALVLNAYCNRLINNPQDAANAFRYVIRSQGILDMKKEYDTERSKVLGQLDELSNLEKDALERRQPHIYKDISELRMELSEFMLRVRERGDTGSQLIEDYYEERLDVMEHILRLDNIIEWAEETEEYEIAEKAHDQKDRLTKVLEVFKGDRNAINNAFLIDYPLAAKEALYYYKSENLDQVFYEMSTEKRRVENTLKEMDRLTSLSDYNLSQQMDVELLFFEMENLRNRLNKLQKAMNEIDPEKPETNIDYWSDLSGFGVSDIIYKERKSKLAGIDVRSDKITIINDLLKTRRAEIEKKLNDFEKEIKKLQDKLLSRKIQLEQMERDKYIESFYYDTKEKEEETWEDRLLQYKTQ